MQTTEQLAARIVATSLIAMLANADLMEAEKLCEELSSKFDGTKTFDLKCMELARDIVGEFRGELPQHVLPNINMLISRFHAAAGNDALEQPMDDAPDGNPRRYRLTEGEPYTETQVHATAVGFIQQLTLTGERDAKAIASEFKLMFAESGVTKFERAYIARALELAKNSPEDAYVTLVEQLNTICQEAA